MLRLDMISVVIPSYRDPLLQKTIDSLLQNAEQEIEVILQHLEQQNEIPMKMVEKLGVNLEKPVR